MNTKHFFKLCLALTLGFALVTCATVPLTQRTQLSLVSDPQMVQLGVDNYQQVLGESKLSSDPAKVQLVRKVGGRCAMAAEEYLRRYGYSRQGYQWEFAVIEDDETINAWCLPGGKIAVYTGLLKVTQNEAGLAVVLGHEIAHAIAKHGNERMSQALLVELGGQALASAIQQRPQRTQDLFLRSYGAAIQVGVMLPYSRVQENEGDRIGLTITAMAGYDPREAIGLWQRMNQAGGTRMPQFLSSHPAPQARIEQIQRYIPEAMQHYRPQ